MKNNFEIYNFYDTDDMGFEEYDITGKEYESLIRACCKYCVVLSFRITKPNVKALIELEKFRIKKPDNITFEFVHYGKGANVHYFRICDEVCNILLNTTNNIFSWITGWGYENPDDPTFYREDGSVFFTSTIHDGECTLFIRDEDVSEILANKLWTKGTGHGNRYTVIPK